MEIPSWFLRIFRVEKQAYNPPMRLSPTGEREYTPTEAALLMGVSRQRIHKYIDDERIEFRRDGKRYFIPEHAIGIIKPSTKQTGRPRIHRKYRKAY